MYFFVKSKYNEHIDCDAHPELFMGYSFDQRSIIAKLKGALCDLSSEQLIFVERAKGGAISAQLMVEDGPPYKPDGKFVLKMILHDAKDAELFINRVLLLG